MSIYDPADVNADQAKKLEQVADSYKLLASILEEGLPPGREAALAKTNLEQSFLWATVAITTAKQNVVKFPMEKL